MVLGAIEFQERLAGVVAALDRVSAGVRIVCVTKTHPVEDLRVVLDAGCVDLGENYLGELEGKSRLLEVEYTPRWHFLGHLQRNKIARIAALCAEIHSVSRSEEIASLARRGFAGRIYLQVAAPGGGESRSGADAAEIPGLVEHARSLSVDVAGLMAMALPGSDAEVASYFRSVAQLADRLGLAEKSMGMSGDFLIAAAEGATVVRLGTVLLGQRSL